MVKLINPVFKNVTDMIGGLIQEKKKKKKKVTIAPSKTSVLKKITPLAPSKPTEIPISYYPRPRPVGRPRRLYDEDAPNIKRRTKAQIASDLAEATKESEQFAKKRAAKKIANPIVSAFRQKQALKRATEFPEYEFPETTAKVKAPKAKKAPGTPREARRTHEEQERDLDTDVLSGRILTKFQQQLLATRAGEAGFLPFGTLEPLVDPSTLKGKSPKPKPSPRKAEAKAKAEAPAEAEAKAPAKRRVQQTTLDTIFGKKASSEAQVGEGRFRKNKRIKKKY